MVRNTRRGTLVKGWAIDTGTNRPTVQLDVFSETVAKTRTGFRRADIRSEHGGNGKAGFQKFIPRQPKGTSVCVSVTDSSTGGTTFLGCKAL